MRIIDWSSDVCSSDLAYEGQIGQAAYSASKGGVVGMTLPMARELARFGIRVNTVAAGIFWTPMVDGMPDEVQQSLSASIPFTSRPGKPEEVADSVRSDERSVGKECVSQCRSRWSPDL